MATAIDISADLAALVTGVTLLRLNPCLDKPHEVRGGDQPGVAARNRTSSARTVSPVTSARPLRRRVDR